MIVIMVPCQVCNTRATKANIYVILTIVAEVEEIK